MEQKDKDLLLKDLCARLAYGVKVKCDNYIMKVLGVHAPGMTVDITDGEHRFSAVRIEEVKPYLRPMSSQTSEEREELNNILEYQYYSDDSCMCEASDWLNAHHFDYRGLIEKGLAIEVTEENNPYKG